MIIQDVLTIKDPLKTFGYAYKYSIDFQDIPEIWHRIPWDPNPNRYPSRCIWMWRICFQPFKILGQDFRFDTKLNSAIFILEILTGFFDVGLCSLVWKLHLKWYWKLTEFLVFYDIETSIYDMTRIGYDGFHSNWFSSNGIIILNWIHSVGGSQIAYIARIHFEYELA